MQTSRSRLLIIILQGFVFTFFCITVALNSLILFRDIPTTNLKSGHHRLHALVKENNQGYPATLVRLPDTSFEFFSTLESLYGSKKLIISTSNIFHLDFLEKNWKYGVFFDLDLKPEHTVRLIDILEFCNTTFINTSDCNLR